MKNKILLLMIALFSLGGLAACGDSGVDSSSTGSIEEEAPADDPLQLQPVDPNADSTTSVN